MAVSIDTVYQKVLALANKEQRGYITPQEFNLFADMAQKEIFEQYFYDINQWTSQEGNSTTFSDMLTNLQEKIDLFHTYAHNVPIISDFGDFIMDDIPNLYRIGRISVNWESETLNTQPEYMTLQEVTTYNLSPLTRPSKKRPIYYRYLHLDGRKFIKIAPNPVMDVDQVQVFYTRKPTQPNWNYITVNQKALYNSTNSVDFELHASEETELVNKILKFSGISMQKQDITQAGAGLESTQVSQEKQ